MKIPRRFLGGLSEYQAALLAIVLVSLVFTVLLLTMPWMIRMAYNDDLPLSFLNDIIKTDSQFTVDHYIEFARDKLFAVMPLAYSFLLLLLVTKYHRRLILGDSESYRDYSTVPVTIVLLLVIFAYCNRFLQDDAFISFRYARNLIHGHGLTWNPGDAPVEGYSNFLWTMYISFLLLIRLDPVIYVQVTGLLLYTASLVVFYKLARRILASARLAICSLIVLGLNYTFSAYATGGLETQLLVLLVLSLFLITARGIDTGRLSRGEALAVSMLSLASLLTRMDSLIFIVVAVSAIMVCRVSRDNKLLFIPFIAIYTLYIAFKLIYYGNVLPNTYYVKVAGMNGMLAGLEYVTGFLLRYGYLPFLLFAAGRVLLKRLLDKWNVILLCLIFTWTAYVVRIGGCFMEYRMMVPLLPFMILLIMRVVISRLSKPLALGLLSILILLSLVHARTFNGQGTVVSVRDSSSWLTTGKWMETGKALGELFGHADPPVTIATTAAGAIPYYSGLRTIDMLGLNDPWIARNGHILDVVKPGHQRISPTSYLLDQQVNIVIAHPQIRSLSTPLSECDIQIWSFLERDIQLDSLPVNMRFLEIPLDQQHKIIALYLMQNDFIDGLLAGGHLHSEPVDLH